MTIPFNSSKEPEPFSEGLAIVHCTDNTSGYVDASGKPVIPCQYTLASRFVHGQAYVRDGNSRNLLIDKTGKILVVPAPILLLAGCAKTAYTHSLAAAMAPDCWMATGVLLFPRYSKA